MVYNHLCGLIYVDDYCVRNPLGHKLSESVWEEAHELGVPMRWVCGSSLRRRRNDLFPCVGWGILCVECFHEVGLWFLSEMKMEQCVPLYGVMNPMSWVCCSLWYEVETMWYSKWSSCEMRWDRDILSRMSLWMSTTGCDPSGWALVSVCPDDSPMRHSEINICWLRRPCGWAQVEMSLVVLWDPLLYFPRVKLTCNPICDVKGTGRPHHKVKYNQCKI